MVDIFHFHSPIFSQLQSPPKIRSSTSGIFYLIFRPNLFVKSSLQSPLTLPSSISQQFSPLYFCVQLTLQATSKVFSLPLSFIQFRLRQGTNKKGSFVRTDNSLISLFFLKVQESIAGLTVTDSLPLVVSDEDACNQNEKPSSPPSPLSLLSIVINSIPYYYNQKNQHSPIEKLFNQIFILSLGFLYTIHAPLHPYVQKRSPPAIK